MASIDPNLTAEFAARIAALAMDGIRREYPNKIAHVLTGDADALPPRRLTPLFYGCFDWHSAVHSHWCGCCGVFRMPRGSRMRDARSRRM